VSKWILPPLECFSQVFCHSAEKVTNTAATGMFWVEAKSDVGSEVKNTQPYNLLRYYILSALLLSNFFEELYIPTAVPIHHSITLIYSLVHCNLFLIDHCTIKSNNPGQCSISQASLQVCDKNFFPVA
jgi:hypothetical protein